jgi:hypothetical protein
VKGKYGKKNHKKDNMCYGCNNVKKNEITKNFLR